MRLIDLVNKLKSEGQEITYYKRKDRGIVITSIGGVKFKGKSGNVYLRQITGQSLTPKLTAHLNKIRRSGKRVDPLAKELEKQVRKTQKAMKHGTPGKQAKVKTKRVRENVKKFGAESTLKTLKQQERYAKGYAYEANIDWLIDRLRAWLPYTEELIKLINKKRKTFRDEWINDINQAFYSVEAGRSQIETAVNYSIARIKGQF